jgi:hypothetical protein
VLFLAFDAGEENCRSLGFGPPNFLWNLVALSHIMRLPLRKGASADLSSAAWQEIRVRDDKSRAAVHLVVCYADGGTADPSAPPDFLSRVAAPIGCVWFSLRRTT